MKRSSEASPPRKRLASRFSAADFPDTEDKPLFEIDFTSYARTHSPDVVISNGSIEFQSHKKILQACSPVIDAMFQSDSTAKEVTLTNVPDKALELFYNLLYDNHEERKARRVTDPQIRDTFGYVKGCMVLDGKYDCTLMHQWLVRKLDTTVWPRGEAFQNIRRAALDLKLNDLAQVMEKTHVRCRNTPTFVLNSFSEEMVLKMVKTQDFSSDFSFFEKALKYANEKRNEAVKKALDEVGMEGKAWKQKYLLEKKKSEAFSKMMWEKPNHGNFFGGAFLFGRAHGRGGRGRGGRE